MIALTPVDILKWGNLLFELAGLIFLAAMWVYLMTRGSRIDSLGLFGGRALKGPARYVIAAVLLAGIVGAMWYLLANSRL